MAWLAKSSRGKERLFRDRPRQFYFRWDPTGEDCVDWTDGDPELAGKYDTHIELPKGSIKKLIGKDLTWQDEPVELIADGQEG